MNPADTEEEQKKAARREYYQTHKEQFKQYIAKCSIKSRERYASDPNYRAKRIEAAKASKLKKLLNEGKPIYEKRGRPAIHKIDSTTE